MKRGLFVHVFLSAAATLCVAVDLAGCIMVPVRMTTSTQTPAGQKLTLPAALPEPNRTTRKEVEESYRAFAVPSGIPNLFWGQFQQSSWAIVFGTYGAAGGNRIWGTQNLLITFDDKDVAKTVEVVPENKLRGRIADLYSEKILPQLDFSQPIQVKGMGLYQYSQTILTLELTHNAMKITADAATRAVRKKATPPEVETLSVDQIKDLTVNEIPDHWDARFKEPPVSMKMRFVERSSFGKSIEFYVEPRDVITLICWHEQAGAGRQRPDSSPSRQSR